MDRREKPVTSRECRLAHPPPLGPPQLNGGACRLGSFQYLAYGSLWSGARGFFTCRAFAGLVCVYACARDTVPDCATALSANAPSIAPTQTIVMIFMAASHSTAPREARPPPPRAPALQTQS